MDLFSSPDAIPEENPEAKLQVPPETVDAPAAWLKTPPPIDGH